MSEKKSFFRVAKKQLTRQQEKIRQKLSKTEHVEDEEFAEHVANFNAQAMHATRLHKEVGNYIKAVRTMAAASRSLGDAIKTVYDPDWDNSEEAYSTIETLEQIYMDLVEKLQEEVLEPLSSYTSQFPVIKARIAKRDRRCLDFEHAKRVLDHAKEKTSTHKAQQAQDAFENAKHQFESINHECHDMLPSFYQGRVPFYAAVLHSYFTSEAVFHGASQSVHGELQQYLDAVADNVPSRAQAPRIRPMSDELEDQQLRDSDGDGDDDDDEENGSRTTTQEQQQQIPEDETHKTTTEALPEVLMTPAPEPPESDSAPEPDTSAHVLEVRIATHPYDGQDEDELTLRKGDVIDVLEFEDPEFEVRSALLTAASWRGDC
ncbi:hypothetical protein PTSG_04062 [Salpingoeca rosetta]|uniref:BAR domain-containing protein n=1 Tax=Salpingoeca rosetta (strain ATCC 50818 / BSB-021) TaxID=946362 RepID=F2U7N8_SALR5|nr:uncharacterized protein PTSG_04062 [Salpingoeca rosetta]EGD83455.1 hypothetical protein PTSG_04062 [Salpingoeca rosetta]|eukprot:XP_004994959.1 hypothetical protein PTSG_04062 [Salpingoeca rosetta]